MNGEKNMPPDMLLDSEGYPTEELLEYIRAYKPSDDCPVLAFLHDVIEPSWWMPGFGFKLSREYRGKRKLELHTWGWSGNEDIVRAILSNIHLVAISMEHTAWKAGGHYYFEIPCP